MSRSYFEEELRYLHEAGKAFARAHPDQARLLNADSIADRDPYVERLFEGFAFLTGRVRQQLDDEFPQYTEGLFQLLYPHFLRPVPACAIAEFTPHPGLVQKTTTLERGTEVRSAPVGEERATCRFTTTQAVRLQPLRLTAAELIWGVGGGTGCRLAFELESGVAYESLDLEPLRLTFNADASTASTAHLFFCRHVRRVTLRGGGSEVEWIGQGAVTPGGLAADEGLVPYGAHALAGFRLLLEYFAFRPKFWAVDLHGLGTLRPEAGATTFEVQVEFDRPYPEARAFTAGNVRLFCTPVVNLFRQDAEPIRTEHERAELLVVPNARQPASHRVYSVEAVTGTDVKTGHRRVYRPYFSFRRPAPGEGTFHALSRTGVGGRPETVLSIQPPEADAARVAAETLSLDVLCTNGALPRDQLQEGAIDQAAPGVPALAACRNLTQPTAEVDPPSRHDPEYLWKLLSHLALNHVSVADRDALRAVLGLYEWTESDANRRRLSGVLDVSWAPREVVLRGAVVRGTLVTVQVEAARFADEGDLCLFGLVLSAALSAYATINSFVHLDLSSFPSGTVYSWTPKHGDRPAL